jgi:SAM-dependent methyltransferase
MTEQLTDTTPPAEPGTRGEQLAERILDGVTAGVELATLELGRRLGLYIALADAGPTTVRQFSDRTGVVDRYAREWLEQQAAAGFIDASEHADAAEREYWLPAEHEAVLVDEDSPSYMLGAAPMLTGTVLPIAAVTDAYRTGEGVAYEQFGAEVRHGIASLNRPSFRNDLPDWIRAVPGLHEKLEAGASVLDAGCGVGWSSIAVAEQYPRVSVHGVDLDEASIVEARQHAADRGVDDRVTFTVANGNEPLGEDRYDLACLFETLHDMGDPIGVLRAVHDALRPGGVVLIADERVSDQFVAPAGAIERLQFAFSVLHCLPATMAESTAVANGTILRTPTVERWSEEAGFSMSVLDVDHLFWKLYALHPRSLG